MPVMFFQLSVNHEGVISGAFQSTLTNDSKQVAGKVDKASGAPPGESATTRRRSTKRLWPI